MKSQLSNTTLSLKLSQRLLQRSASALTRMAAVAAIVLSTACASMPSGGGAQATGSAASADINASGQRSSSLINHVVVQPLALPGPRKTPVQIAAIRIDRHFESSQLAATPLGKRLGTIARQQSRPASWVKVVGSYTPVAVYDEPVVGARLLTRVAPGARLRTGGAVNGWLQVETSAGPGFIRARDGEKIDARVVRAAST